MGLPRVGDKAVLIADPEHEVFRVGWVDRKNYTARLITEDEFWAGSWPKRPALLWEWIEFRKPY